MWFPSCLLLFSALGEDFFRVKMLNFRSMIEEIFRVVPDEELL
jgi:hypothetical protein